MIDEEFEEYRVFKFFDEEVIFIIVDIFFCKDFELLNRDVFVSSVVGLFLFVFERVLELFFFKVNCIDKEDKKFFKSNLEVVVNDFDKDEILGIRWYV